MLPTYSCTPRVQIHPPPTTRHSKSQTLSPVPNIYTNTSQPESYHNQEAAATKPNQDDNNNNNNNNNMVKDHQKQMEVVKGIDLKRYMGRWYEIASFPSFFQPKNGINTRATYTLNDDGATVKVLNETWSNGKRDYIEGVAYKADPNSDEAKLKVKFYLPPFLPIIPVVGDYWVLYLDDDYQYAVVGQPSRKYLWILSRKNEIDEEVYNKLVEKAAEEGYDVSKLHKTPQTNPPPEADEAPTDTKGIWWIKSIFGK